MGIKHYAELLRRRLWLILLAAVLAGIVAYVVAIQSVPVYQATSLVLVTQSSNDLETTYNDVLLNERLTATFARMLRATPVLDQVIANLELSTNARGLGARVTIDVLPNTQMLEIVVEDTNREHAAAIANEIVSVFQKQREEAQAVRFSTSRENLQQQLDLLQADISRAEAALAAIADKSDPASVAERSSWESLLAQYRATFSTLSTSLEQIRLAATQNSNTISMVEPATAPTGPIRPRPLTSAILGCMLGLLVSVGFLLTRDFLDDTVKDKFHVEQQVRLSSIGTISTISGSTELDKLVAITPSYSPASEEYRVLVANIQFSEVDKPMRTIVVNSGSPGEGKTLTTANLAVTLAQMGSRRVIVMDCDLRRPTLHKYFNQSNTLGVTNALLNHDESVAIYLQATGVDNLSLLASGPLPPNPADLIASGRMAQLLEELKSLADVIVIDSPPSLVVADASLLSRSCDATLVVVRAGTTKIENVKRTYEQLSQTGGRLLGFVLNRAALRTEGYYYYGESTSSRQGSSWRRSLPLVGSRSGQCPSPGGHEHGKQIDRRSDKLVVQRAAPTTKLDDR